LSRARLVCHTQRMNTPSSTRSKNHRFPVEIISHGVWLYCRFCLSYRDVEELLLVRGVIVSYEAIRKWCRTFGQPYAHQLRRRCLQPGDKWHPDEVLLTVQGQRQYLWRAADQDGHLLDILVQIPRDKKAAKRIFRKLPKGCQYVPRVIITDRLKSYGGAFPPTTSLIFCLGLPARDAAMIPHLAGTDEPTHRRIRGETRGKSTLACPLSISTGHKLTTPFFDFGIQLYNFLALHSEESHARHYTHRP
jgi:transposase-like protein